jgi:hypothetical protein
MGAWQGCVDIMAQGLGVVAVAAASDQMRREACAAAWHWRLGSHCDYYMLIKGLTHVTMACTFAELGLRTSQQTNRPCMRVEENPMTAVLQCSPEMLVSTLMAEMPMVMVVKVPQLR